MSRWICKPHSNNRHPLLHPAHLVIQIGTWVLTASTMSVIPVSVLLQSPQVRLGDGWRRLRLIRVQRRLHQLPSAQPSRLSWQACQRNRCCFGQSERRPSICEDIRMPEESPHASVTRCIDWSWDKPLSNQRYQLGWPIKRSKLMNSLHWKCKSISPP